MKKRRFAAVILAVMFLALNCGCKNKNSSGPSASSSKKSEETSVTAELLCNFSDSFDPFTAATELNRRLSKLLYDPLIKVDENFEPYYCLASSAEVKDKECTVKIKSAAFTDGSNVTAEDIIYSYEAAKNSAAYGPQLYEVTGAKAASSDTVVFSLSRYDRYFVNLLDFPIIKKNSDKSADSDGVIIPPVGSGRYKADTENMCFIQNEAYFGEKGEIKKIKLINTPDFESESHYVEIGACDIYYADLSDGNIVRMSGKRCDLNLNNLVYIGINGNNEALKNSYLRYAISSAIDRKAVCSQSYYTNALPAKGFFHPDFESTKALQTINFSSDLEITVENLAKIGYNSLDESGYRVNSAGRHITLSLLVNSENASRKAAASQIADQLKEAGLEIKVIEKSYAEYTADLAAGSFDLYLGEIKILKNMDLSPLVISGGSAAFGVVNPEKPKEGGEDTDKPAVSIEDAYNGYFAGTYSAADLESILLTQMPQIPICYRNGILFFDSDIKSGVRATESDIYFSIEKYKYKK